jgi:hypothetical protein
MLCISKADLSDKKGKYFVAIRIVLIRQNVEAILSFRFSHFACARSISVIETARDFVAVRSAGVREVIGHAGEDFERSVSELERTRAAERKQQWWRCLCPGRQADRHLRQELPGTVAAV